MSHWKALVLTPFAAVLMHGAAVAPAQISVNIGPAPACPYGYYDYAPYSCSPYGYNGPDWFNGGVFIGAGPWFHGPRGFYGHVDNRYDSRHGYAGPYPERGEQAFNHIHPNEAHDYQGHVGDAGHDAGREHWAGAQGGYHGGGGGGGFHGGGRGR